MARQTKEQSEAEFIKEVNKWIKEDKDFDEHNRRKAIEDLKFANPADPQQWNAGTMQDRNDDGRPYLTANLFPQYCNQIINDIRHNRPRAKVEPADAQADISIAKIREGIISDSEYKSNSDAIYVEAGTMLVYSGYGAWAIKTRYCDDNPFVQEFYDEYIEDPITTVYMDCHAKDPVYADANRCCRIHVLPESKFKEEYPDAKVPDERNFDLGEAGMTKSFWYKKDHVTIVEAYKRVREKRTLCLMSDYTVMDKKDYEEALKKWEEKNRQYQEMVQAAQAAMQKAMMQQQAAPIQPGVAAPAPNAMPLSGGANNNAPTGAVPPIPSSPQGQGPMPPPMPQLPPPPPKPEIIKDREAERYVVKRYLLTAKSILSKNGIEGERIPGETIPIVLVTGNRIMIEGKRYVCGFVRNGKDQARFLNYALTSLAEAIGIQPKSPFMATAEQIEGHEKKFAEANRRNIPVITYNAATDDEGHPVPPPMRQPPPQASSALFGQVTTAHQLFEGALGMHKPDVGSDEGQGRTGAAVYARQKPGDLGSFQYIDNLARGIAHGARIKNGMISELMDVEMDVKLRDMEDGTETWVPINTTAGDAFKRIKADPTRYQGMNTTRLVAAIQQIGPDAKFNDITAGKYSVKITVGPSYATQRQESAEFMLRMCNSLPQKMQMAADVIMRNSGVKDADLVADRIKKTYPPGFVDLNPGEKPFVPPPNPQIRLLASKERTQQMIQEKEKLKAQLEMVKLYKETHESDKETRKMILDTFNQLLLPAGQHPADQFTDIGEME